MMWRAYDDANTPEPVKDSGAWMDQGELPECRLC